MLCCTGSTWICTLSKFCWGCPPAWAKHRINRAGKVECRVFLVIVDSPFWRRRSGTQTNLAFGAAGTVTLAPIAGMLRFAHLLLVFGIQRFGAAPSCCVGQSIPIRHLV